MKFAPWLASIFFFYASQLSIAESPTVESTLDESSAVQALRAYLAQPMDARGELASQEFAKLPLTKDDALITHDLLWQDRKQQLQRERAAELEAGQITSGDKVMPFTTQEFGEKPKSGWSLVISMHGGGQARAAVNDQQWQNQQKLYQLKEGIYVAPRAPTNNWNLWHEEHIDAMLDRLIEDLIVLRDVDPNRVYLTGYSAGGDGVYQLAPRMADRFAAAAMMAGHPNEASPLGLRNLPLAIHVGEKDDAYNRNKVAAEWGDKLKALRAADPAGYESYAKLHTGRGHWMNREDAEAIDWMAQHTRNPWPSKVVWRQDDVLGTRFYWLAATRQSAKVGQEITATIQGQSIRVIKPAEVELKVRLNDHLLNLDQDIELTVNDQPSKTVKVQRTIAIQAQTLQERADPCAGFCAEVSLTP